MAEQKSVSIYDILTKIGELSGKSFKSMTLDDTLDSHLSVPDVAELLAYLATYLGYDSDRLCAEITGENTIEDLYQWLRREQDAAGVEDCNFYAAHLYDSNVDACFSAHEKLTRFHRSKWHLRESVKLLEAVQRDRQVDVNALKADYAKERKGCTGSAAVLTLILMIPAAIFLGNTARMIVLGLLALHLVATLVFRIWGLNGEDCRKREAEIERAEKKVQEIEDQLTELRSELSAMS